MAGYGNSQANVIRQATTTYDPNRTQQVSFDAGGMMPFFAPPPIGPQQSTGGAAATTPRAAGGSGWGGSKPKGGENITRVAVYGKRYKGAVIPSDASDPQAEVVGYRYVNDQGIPVG